jgi:predicted HTH transcriptional regulator
MPPSNIDLQIRFHIESFTRELTELVKQAALSSVQDAFNGGAPARAGRQTPTKRAAPRRSSRSGRRSSEQIENMGRTILAHVSSNQGHRLEEISAALKIPSKDLKRPVAILLEAKKLRKRGKKRGTQYFAGSGGGTKPKAKPKATKRKTAKRKAAKRKVTKA